MRRVATGSQTTALGTPNAEIGTPGFFNQAAPAAGVVPTIPGPDWFNSVQEELVALATAAGAALDASGAVNNQALTALLAVFTPQIAGYSTPGTYTYTVPAGKTQIHVEVWGAGGGGGGSAATAGAAGGGGGGGAYARALLTGLTPGQQIAVTVGQAGAGGAGGAGGNGTASSVGADIFCGGGSGGGYGSSSSSPGASGAGGAPTVSGSPPFSVAFSGSAGGLGGPVGTASAVIAAQGGASFGFVGAALSLGGTAATPVSPSFFLAGGGGGGANGGDGGYGGNGLVIIRA